MPMTEENHITPASIFLDVQHKVESGHEYHAADAKIDFQRLFTALRASLSESENLKAQLVTSEALITEHTIEMFNKDLELFNAITQLDTMKDKK